MTVTAADTARLVAAARAAMGHAHAPYSRFRVGAAVLLTDGTIVHGSNFENASYGLSLCAETVALAAANARGQLADVTAIAVAGRRMEDGDAMQGAIITPCGRCRQVMAEAERVAGRPLAIFCAAPHGDALVAYDLATLLPHAFGPADLDLPSVTRT
ncbi:MAG: cytidine deaminase [Sphingobium sp.]